MPLVLAAGSMLDTDPATLADAAAAAGFDGIGLRLSGEHAVRAPAAMARRIAGSGLSVFDVEVYRITHDSQDPAPLLDAAAELGADSVLVVSDVAGLGATLDALGALRAQCASRGLGLGLEYMAWTTPRTPDDAMRIANDVGCSIVVDVLHHARVGAGVPELDAIIGSGRLGWVQVCDAPASGAALSDHERLVHEARHARLPPGRGGLPLGALLARLPTGTTVSVEVQSDELLAVDPLARARLLHDAARSQLPSNTG